MLDYYYYIVYSTEFLAAISATVFLYKYKHTTLVWLLPLLWFIPVNELICQYFFSKTPTGYFLKNIYRSIVPLTIVVLVLSRLRQPANILFVKILLIVAVLFYTVELWLINPLNTFFSFSFTTSSIIIVISLLVYFVEELKGDHVTQVSRNLFLWVCFGFLIFNITYPVIFFAEKYSSPDNNVLFSGLYRIQLIVAIISYLHIAFAFYWGDKIDKSKIELK